MHRIEALAPLVMDKVRAEREALLKAADPSKKLQALESFLGKRTSKDLLSTQPRDIRISNLRVLVREANFANNEKPMRVVETLERHFGVTPEPDTSFDQRLTELENQVTSKLAKTKDLNVYLTLAAIRMSHVEQSKNQK